MINSAVLILAVLRTPVSYELSKMTLLFMSSRSSVDRVPARCSGGHGFDSCRGLMRNLHSFITTDDEFSSADPSSMQDTCHI